MRHDVLIAGGGLTDLILALWLTPRNSISSMLGSIVAYRHRTDDNGHRQPQVWIPMPPH
jgi:hypothetical protein